MSRYTRASCSAQVFRSLGDILPGSAALQGLRAFGTCVSVKPVKSDMNGVEAVWKGSISSLKAGCVYPVVCDWLDSLPGHLVLLSVSRLKSFTPHLHLSDWQREFPKTLERFLQLA